MKLPRRTLLMSLALLGGTAVLPMTAAADGKPLKILVGYPAGGAVDVVARQVGEEMRGAQAAHQSQSRQTEGKGVAAGRGPGRYQALGGHLVGTR